jgi:superoxide dismutase, Fe-Mn family
MNTNPKSRREFIKTAGKAGLAAGLTGIALPSPGADSSSINEYLYQGGDDGIGYEQKPLPYSYSALEPSIDAMTMEIHYSKHAASYAKNLAEAVGIEKVDMKKVSLQKLLNNISKYSVKMRNNAGGHYNHELFWKTMKAPGTSGELSGSLRAAIEKDFNSIEAFKNQFADAAKNRFGSGWAWLIMTPSKKLMIGSTPNQDNPLMNVTAFKGYPLLGLDVWEHAYYLKYQNRRPDYINAWWNLVDWSVVGQRYETNR